MYESNDTGKRRQPFYLTVGVLIDSVDTYFNKRIVSDLIDAGDEHSVHMIFYVGGEYVPGGTNGSGIYNLPHSETLHALIVVPNTICPETPAQAIAELKTEFGDLPVYSLFASIPDVYSIVPDETNAIKSLVHHLTDYHKYTRIAVLTGPDSPVSLSNTRLKIIRETLSEQKLTLKDELVWEGSFRIEDGKQAVSRLLLIEQDSPQTLICLNDEMAIGAIQEFNGNGISIPGDIAVTGFDDITENTTLPCLLSTVNYPVWEMLNVLIERIISDQNDSTVYEGVTRTFEARFMHRESCGCSGFLDKHINSPEGFIPQDEVRSSNARLKRAADARRNLQEVPERSIEEEDAGPFGKAFKTVLNDMARAGDFTNTFVDTFSTLWTSTLLKNPDPEKQIFINAIFIDAFRLLIQTRTQMFTRLHEIDLGALSFYRETNTLLARKLGVFEALKGIGSQLPALGIQRCILATRNPLIPNIGEIRLSYKEGYFTDIPRSLGIRFPARKLLDTELSAISDPLIVLPVTHDSIDYGFVLFTITDKQFDSLEMIARQMSHILAGAIATDRLAEKQQEMKTHIKVLEQENLDLSKLSEIDELTALHNRRTLYTTGKKRYKDCLSASQNSCCIFLDMDGLKIINDNYGHKDGDIAIQGLAGILKNSFREDDLVIRYGGDEFVVLMFNINEEAVQMALERIQNQLKDFNDTGKYPWRLSSSWGYVFADATGNPPTFEELIEESDARLYLAKKNRIRVKL